jgi:hypothetical protein
MTAVAAATAAIVIVTTIDASRFFSSQLGKQRGILDF